MIENKKQLAHSKGALALLRGARLALEKKMAHRDKALFRAMARIYLEGEDRIRQEVHVYEKRR